MEKTKKNDFVEVKFTGMANGTVFDSNIDEDLKNAHPDAKAEKMVVCVGQEMILSGLDKALEDKEIGKEYKLELKAKEAFGERKKELVKTIPMSIFAEKNIMPRPGMAFTFDNSLAKVVAVSGGRVMTDFNNPLAGKDVSYKFIIVRKVDDNKEKAEALFKFFFRFVPEFEVKDKIVVKGPKILEGIVNSMNDKFKSLIGKELAFEVKEKPIEETVESK